MSSTSRRSRSRAKRPSASLAAEPLVCPFCGEPGPPGARRCPAHDLELAARREVPAASSTPGPDPMADPDGDVDPEDRHPPDERALEVYDLRSGRGWVLLAAICFLGGLVLPFADLGVETVVVRSGLEVARERVAALWAVPCAGVWLMLVFRRRRTPRSLRGVRLAVPLLGLLAASAVAYAFYRFDQIGRALAAQGVELDLSPLSGPVVIGIGVAATLVAVPFLGRVPGSARLRSPDPASSSPH